MSDKHSPKQLFLECKDCGFIGEEDQFSSSPDNQHCPICGVGENHLVEAELSDSIITKLNSHAKLVEANNLAQIALDEIWECYNLVNANKENSTYKKVKQAREALAEAGEA